MPHSLRSKVGYTMRKINHILKRILVYSWKASPITFLLLLAVSLLFCIIKFFEITVFEQLIHSVTLVYKGGDISLVTQALLSLGAILVLNPIVELVEFLTRGYFWRRGHGYMQAVFHDRVSKNALIDFENSEDFDHMKRASLGSSETPNNIRILIQIVFLYLPFFAVVAYYLFTIKALLVLVLLLIFLPLLLAEIIKMNNRYDFEDDIATTRRQIDYYEKCMTDNTHFKETLQNDAFQYFNKKLIIAIDDFKTKHHLLIVKAFKLETVMNSLNILGYLGVILLLIYYLATSQISISEFATVYYAIDKITSMLKRLITDVGEVLEEMTTTQYLIDFLDIDADERKATMIPKDTDIHLDNVSFSYPNQTRNAISNLTLTIPQGTSLAIVGENGSGKSTLSKLIMGLYKPKSGRVLYGKKDISDYQDDCKYENTSAVFQDFCKYKLSVEENIELSDQHAKTTIKDAIDNSHFSLTNLSKAESTVLSREFGGQDLSGGQWQRLAIARGLYRQHDLIVLDEPTAAIDPIEEEQVFRAFQNASQEKTSILVTHRLGSVQFADLIAVMEHGQLIELGTHQELLNQKGRYLELFMSQAKWYHGR